MNLNTLITALSGVSDATPLIFATTDKEIGAGYHVTELKLAQITGIDCAARVATWAEASLQLLDGEGRGHMQLGKFKGILRQSVSKVAGLDEAPVKVEFAHGNAGMRTYEMEEPELRQDKVVIRLRESRAVCKPAYSFSGIQRLAKAKAQAAKARECCT